jgi:hypothetical protein
MTTYVYRDGKVVEKNSVQRTESFSYISDNMDPLVHHADGKKYDSKSTFRRVTKDHGCVEIGDDTNWRRPRSPEKLDKRQRLDDIKRAVYELRNGRGRR